MENLKIAKEISGLVKEIEVLDSKIDSLSEFANKLMSSPHGHVEMGLEEFDFENVPQIQFIAAPSDNPEEESAPVGYTKIFEGSGNINIYSVLIHNPVALSVIDLVIGKMKAEKIFKQSKLNSLIPGDGVYGYSINLNK